MQIEVLKILDFQIKKLASYSGIKNSNIVIVCVVFSKIMLIHRAITLFQMGMVL